MNSGLVCQNVSLFRRGADGSERAVLQAVNVAFNVGQCTIISGITGSGKSTLLQLVAGLLRPSAGRILADGRPVSRWNTAYRDRWRRRVGIVFQQPYLLKGLTVFENVVFPLIPRGHSLDRLRRLGYAALENLRISHLAGQHVYALSGGEQQRVSIARAIVCEPEILIADEPTAHQDDEGTAMLIENFTRWKRPDTVIVMAAHDSRLVQHGKLADRLFRLDDGYLKDPA